MIPEKKNLWIGIIASVVIVLGFYHSLLFNVSNPLGLLHGDTYLVNFIFKHYFYVFQTGRWDELTTLPMFYGFENSLFYSDHHLIHAVLAYPWFLITGSVITTTNSYVLFTLVTSAVAMYLFLLHLTKNIVGSVIGAIIFVCNPFVTARFPDHLILLSLQWIPLIFLFFERLLQKQRATDGFFFFFFLLCQLLSSLYYSAFLSLLLPIYALIRIRQMRVHLLWIVNRGVLLGGVFFIITVVLSSYFYLQVFAKESINRSLDAAVATYAARVSDYFFTAPNNVLYGGIKESASQMFPTAVRMGIWSEHNLFWGVTVFVLFVLSFFVLRKTDKRGYWLLCVSLIAFCALLSFGPKIVITDTITLPGIYPLFYYLDPLLQFIRTTARFGVFIFFFLSIIATMTFSELWGRKSAGRQFLIGSVIILLILVEYQIKPLDSYQKNEKDVKLYSVLNKRTDLKVLVDLPIGNLIPYTYPQARSEELDSHYLFYAVIYHNKKLLNGYTGFLPKEYYRRGHLLSVNFPTVSKLKQLREWGADAVILHREEFNNPGDYDVMRRSLLDKNVPLLDETEGIALFDLTRWE